MEYCFSGYCRQTDGARTVFYDDEEGADCVFPQCMFAGDCPIARQIRENTAQNGG